MSVDAGRDDERALRLAGSRRSSFWKSASRRSFIVSVKSLAQLARQVLGEPANVAVGDEAGEQLAGVAATSLVDALQPLDEAADVVVAVPVLPDLLDDLRRWSCRRPRAARRSCRWCCGSTRAACRRSSRRRRSATCPGTCSPLRVPRPSICSNRMRDFTGRRKTRNSRSGMSTPVVSRSTVTTMPASGGCGTRGCAAAAGRRGR